MPNPTTPAKRAPSAILNLGLRPFFLLAGLWAGLAMILWLGMLVGHVAPPSTFYPTDWHLHELLFGFLSAVIAGFLLTAVPNWTRRPALQGNWLGALVLLWLAGRVAMLWAPGWLAFPLALAFLPCLTLFIGRELVAANNRRNFIVLVTLLAMIGAEGLFLFEDWRDEATRLVVASAVMLITVIGGRVTPAFTANWLRRKGQEVAPMSMPWLDNAILWASPPVLVLWVIAPLSPLNGILLGILCLAQLLRMSRWNGHHSLSEPLVAVLHLAYLFIPLGYLALSLAAMRPYWIDLTTALHVWTVGAVGLMTLAMMTRASLGHTGQALHAGAGTTVLYLALLLSVITRILAGVADDFIMAFYNLSAISWSIAFLGFAVLYGPALLRERKDS